MVLKIKKRENGECVKNQEQYSASVPAGHFCLCLILEGIEGTAHFQWAIVKSTCVCIYILVEKTNHLTDCSFFSFASSCSGSVTLTNDFLGPLCFIYLNEWVFLLSYFPIIPISRWCIAWIFVTSGEKEGKKSGFGFCSCSDVANWCNQHLWVSCQEGNMFTSSVVLQRAGFLKIIDSMWLVSGQTFVCPSGIKSLRLEKTANMYFLNSHKWSEKLENCGWQSSYRFGDIWILVCKAMARKIEWP